MEKLIETLKSIGISDEELHRVVKYYRDDLDGFTQYVLYMRTMFDDRCEYI